MSVRAGVLAAAFTPHPRRRSDAYSNGWYLLSRLNPPSRPPLVGPIRVPPLLFRFSALSCPMDLPLQFFFHRLFFLACLRFINFCCLFNTSERRVWICLISCLSVYYLLSCFYQKAFIIHGVPLILIYCCFFSWLLYAIFM